MTRQCPSSRQADASELELRRRLMAGSEWSLKPRLRPGDRCQQGTLKQIMANIAWRRGHRPGHRAAHGGLAGVGRTPVVGGRRLLPTRAGVPVACRS